MAEELLVKIVMMNIPTEKRSRGRPNEGGDVLIETGTSLHNSRSRRGIIIKIVERTRGRNDVSKIKGTVYF